MLTCLDENLAVKLGLIGQQAWLQPFSDSESMSMSIVRVRVPLKMRARSLPPWKRLRSLMRMEFGVNSKWTVAMKRNRTEIPKF